MTRPSPRFLVCSALLVGNAFALDSSAPLVRAGSESADGAAVVRAWGRVPGFQLVELGADDAARRRAVVERLLVPELQGAAEARARGLDKRPRTADRIKELYARAMDAELAWDVVTRTPLRTRSPK